VARAYGAKNAEAARSAGSQAATVEVLKSVGKHLSYRPSVRTRLRELLAEKRRHEEHNRAGLPWQPSPRAGHVRDRPAAGLLTDEENGVRHRYPDVEVPPGAGGSAAERERIYRMRLRDTGQAVPRPPSASPATMEPATTEPVTAEEATIRRELARRRVEAERMDGAAARSVHWHLLEPRYLPGGRQNARWAVTPPYWQA
jgi:hypothetical protein